jgi:hypothetical protein
MDDSKNAQRRLFLLPIELIQEAPNLVVTKD